MIDLERKCAIRNLALYLTPDEAFRLCEELGKLLKDPEANKHFHVMTEGYHLPEISCSIITERKLSNIRKYSKLEHKILGEKH
jgi:hypothetical protein